MAYVKQDFTSGQTLTAEHLNNIEAGLIALEEERAYSPVRGTDYWTEEDIATIKAYVDDAILNGSW